MALTTAVSFVFAGGALFLLAARPGAYALFGVFNSIPLILGLTSLVGYSFQSAYVLPLSIATQMALHTSLALLAYGIVMLGYAWKYAERGPDGMPNWGLGIGVALLPVLVVGAATLFPQQSWHVLPLELLVSVLLIALITLAVKRLPTAKVAYKGLLMIPCRCFLVLAFVALVVHMRHQTVAAQSVGRRTRAEVVTVSRSLLMR